MINEIKLFGFDYPITVPIKYGDKSKSRRTICKCL